LEKDESWRPLRENAYRELKSAGGPWTFLRRSPVKFLMYPWYLLSVPDYPTFSGSHFDPRSRLFDNSQRIRAAVSSLSVVGFIVMLFATFALSDLLWYYFVPYVIFTVWLSVVTYLQHSDPKGRYYDNRKWTYASGAMTTFDRSFGFIINHFHHNIETHLVHHFFFTAIPHYHLVEATEAVKPLLGNAYPYDDTNIVAALWNSLDNCDYVTSPNNDGVYDHSEVVNHKNKKKTVKGE
jgi:omega-3 fatty acid desaturase (delta-15 desaturase)